MHSISPCLWFDDNLEEAAKFYTGIFPNSSVNHLLRHNDAGPGKPGTAMAGDFTLDGLRFRGTTAAPSTLASARRSRSASTAGTSPRSTTTGTASSTAARSRCAAGSRTSSASPGRSSRPASTARLRPRPRPRPRRHRGDVHHAEDRDRRHGSRRRLGLRLTHFRWLRRLRRTVETAPTAGRGGRAATVSKPGEGRQGDDPRRQEDFPKCSPHPCQTRAFRAWTVGGRCLS